MAFFRALGLLLWKNFVLQKRKICVSLFEIVLPLFFAVMILIVRLLIKPDRFDSPTIYQDFSPADLNNTFYNGKSIPQQYLLYLPNNTLVDGIMNTAEELLRNQSVSVQVKGFSDEEDMIMFYNMHFLNVSSAVQFKVFGKSLPNILEYSIRPKIHNKSDMWHTRNTYPFFQTNAPREGSFPAYLWSGFILYQRFIDEAIIRHWNVSVGSLLDNLDIRLQRMPYPKYIKDPMITILQNQFSLILMLSFILSTIQNTKAIVYEKERKLKESMKLMGLSAAAHWTAWFLTIFIYTVIIMAIFSVLFSISTGENGAVLANSDPSLFFIFLLCYGVSIIAFCFMISTFIQKANVAAAVAGILFFLTYMPYFFLQQRYEDMGRSEKFAACLLMNMAMAFGGNSIGLYEGTGAGVRWSNFHEPASVDDNFSMLDAIIMLLVDSAIYFLVAWYLDNVRPGEFGTPQPFYFPFTRTYWCGSKHTKIEGLQETFTENKFFEKDPSGLNAGIQISKLSKVYDSCPTPAVKNMTLNMYEGQITVLLGHNGAGKTTTMSILTGFIPPTSGTALVNGYDIRKDMLSVRKSLGLCPQHNILFDTMTVEEHLWFFAVLKGCPYSQVKEEVNNMVQEVGLGLKRNAKSMTLSGGQKRKLSVGIALIGGSKTVILDEPTSGMDPAARRQTWDILQRNRAGRTLVLTTHFMDEADLLGDRIAIMAKGVVNCCGTSYFLKKTYGAGYHLVIVKEQNCKVPQVTAAITMIIPSATLESEINAELSYLLPDDQSHLFATLFTNIENQKRDLGIISFGTSATTMEEVFLKVGESAEDDSSVDNSPLVSTGEMQGFVNKAFESEKENIIQAMNGHENETNRFYHSTDVSVESGNNVVDFNAGYTKVTGLLLEMYRFRGMFVKKAIHTWRNRTITLVQLLLPVIFTIIALVVEKTRPKELGEISLPLDLSAFGGTTVPYTNGTNPTATTQSLVQAYSGLFDSTINKPEDIDRSMYPNITNYFLDKTTEIGLSSFNKRVIIAGEYQSETISPTVARAHYNYQPYHGMPIALAYMMNSLVSHFVHNDHKIITSNYPLPKNVSDSSKTAVTNASGIGFSLSFNILFGMAFLTSSFVYFLIKERLVGAKHLQVVSGIGPSVFWVSNFAWDFINYFIPCLLLLVVFAAFQTSAYIDDNRLGIVVLILLFYGWSVLPFMYILQYIFKSPATGMVVIIVLNIITGLFTTLLTFILALPSLGTEDAGKIFEWIFIVFFPHFCLGRCFFQVYVNTENIDLCQKNHWDLCVPGRPLPCCKSNCEKLGFCVEYESDYLSWNVPGIGRYLIFMIFQGCFFMALTMLIEYQIPQRIWYRIRRPTEETSDRPEGLIPMEFRPQTPNEDSDVLAEKGRIMNTPSEDLALTDSLILNNIYKRYGNSIVVDHITVEIPEKECFGLLGQNGAGKTTTFKMLTGDVMLTGGNVYLKMHDVKTQVQKVRENMGYCPQFDALIDQMTGRETLWMFARFKGVPEHLIGSIVNKLMNIMMLTEYADRQTSKYSGGNKRKLSTAIALVGDPSFILLDEPSTGMDPKARRQLWNVLSKIRESGTTLVLTSHSMEECDALCTRIAIMVNGRFVCLGSPQHLKSKFGQGYTLIAKMSQLPNGMQASSQPLVQFIHSQFPQSLVFDNHQGYAHFQIPDPNVHLATVFTVMEEAKATYGVEDYSVHQTTLEQVFLTFTREQIPPREDKTSFCKRVCCC